MSRNDGELEAMIPDFPPSEAAPDDAGGAPEVTQSTTPVTGRLLNAAAKTPEEVLAYAIELERKQIEAEAKLSAFESVTSKFAPQPSLAATEPPAESLSEEEIEKKYAARMFSEPAKVLKELSQEIEQRIESKKAKSEGDKSFWNAFYEEFSDLNGLDEIVQLQLAKNQEEWKKVPIGQARKLLANAARSYVDKIRDLKTPTETLPSGPAATAGATRGTAPRVETPSEPSSFVEQMRKVNRKYAV